MKGVAAPTNFWLGEYVAELSPAQLAEARKMGLLAEADLAPQQQPMQQEPRQEHQQYPQYQQYQQYQQEPHQEHQQQPQHQPAPPPVSPAAPGRGGVEAATPSPAAECVLPMVMAHGGWTGLSEAGQWQWQVVEQAEQWGLASEGVCCFPLCGGAPAEAEVAPSPQLTGSHGSDVASHFPSQLTTHTGEAGARSPQSVLAPRAAGPCGTTQVGGSGCAVLLPPGMDGLAALFT